MRTRGDRDGVSNCTPHHLARLCASMMKTNARCQRAFTTMPPNTKMEHGEGDQILSSMNLTLTSSKYNELNAQVTLLEWTKTAPLKKSSMPNQLAHEERAGQILDGLMASKNLS
ncbi:hypothetical protein TNCV_1926921 [Trichonephila clavipes]|nr:hypothetical protein TNCV_1926921 [Trichonephila clavipes]